MRSTEREFMQRVSRIPDHGLGLSVDVYSPDLGELLEVLDSRGSGYGYLEVFKASRSALATVRWRMPSVFLEYHGEGLWLTQPDWTTAYPFSIELDTAASHLRMLGSHWMTHECAAKQMAGYSFGTYLPPLFTRAGVEVVAKHVELAQRYLDRSSEGSQGQGPLLLLEIPPLTYFGFGDLRVADFFRLIAEQASCGLVLDIGHLWTVYRYSGEWRHCRLSAFVADFLEAFPVHRVVQIHIAGLAAHESREGESFPLNAECPPWWIDAHGMPIPPVLFDLLEQVLAHPRLIALKGIALEVDTKPVAQIVAEWERFRERFDAWAVERVARKGPGAHRADVGVDSYGGDSSGEGLSPRLSAVDSSELGSQYKRYAQIITGTANAPTPALPSLGVEPGALERYTHGYLPYEILTWGGELREIFPETCRMLERAEIPLEAFVEYWTRTPRPVDAPFDFFLLKLERFSAFVREVLPEAVETTCREADVLRNAYSMANESAGMNR